MQFNQISVVLLLLCFLSTLIADTSNPSHLSGDVLVNCGSSGNSAARDGTKWLGDVQPKFPSMLQMKGSSTASRVTHKLVSENDPVPYSTARLSRSRFSYAFKMNPGLKIVEISGTSFKVQVNEMTACTYNDIVGDKDDEDSIPMLKDYMVMMKGCKFEGKRDVLICLESDHELIDGHGPLKGFEVLKLSNYDNSLASPNPNLLLLGQNVSYRSDQDLHHVLGPKNIMFTVAIRLLALVSIIIYTLCENLEARDIKEENIPSARAEQLCRRFSLAAMRIATRNFSDAHLIGRGGFGQVYKGLIDNGLQTMAIKRLKSNSSQGASEFLMEIEILTEVRHVNLVSLIGYCNENREMILVYEYMACGTLADRLYKHAANREYSSFLTWKQRLIICIGAGRGLDYLHTGNSIIHRDVKTSNILLDESLRAKVSDFGLAKHLSKCKLESHVSRKVKGTFGYIDPKYVTTAKLTMKSDIYAFGVVLLEVLSGRRAVDHHVAEDEQLLTKWARENVSKGRAYRIVDPNLSCEISEHSLQAFVKIADKCLHDEPNQRPTMAEVVLHLIFSLEQQECPKPLAPN